MLNKDRFVVKDHIHRSDNPGAGRITAENVHINCQQGTLQVVGGNFDTSLAQFQFDVALQMKWVRQIDLIGS